jgi:acetyl/propionyl-CoA carboxylase alpha subunit
MRQKVLIANRGEIAVRVIRTCREMDLGTVAVFSDPDADLPHVGLADEAVHLPGSAPSETYLDADALVGAAVRTGADLVHPGYGFLSENAGFARACAAAGLVFVGPPADVIEQMASKLTAKALMVAASVPVLASATVTDDAGLAVLAEGVGFPILVKAALGGGGRGMRLVRAPHELTDAVDAARREAAAAFGDPTVFLERYVDDPRHVEVQVFGDTYGTVVHLFERECSVQRRFQKLVEEAPSPAVDPELRERLCAAAVTAATAIGYVGAGTVEFVLDQEGEFAFLEINTRLQVEHPVTEQVTGLDLVRLQLQVALGEPLPPEARAARLSGHAVEARLYAEDVPGGYLPASGPLHCFDLPDTAHVRVDAGFVAGNRVGTAYDGMLAKVIGHGPTREAARTALADTLSRARVHGVPTNRDLLLGILREPEFVSGRTDTGFLERHPPAQLCPPLTDAARDVHLLAAAVALQAEHRAEAAVLRTLPSGWRNNRSARQVQEFDAGRVDYVLRGGCLDAAVDGRELDRLRLWAATPDRVDLEVDGVRRLVRVAHHGADVFVDSPLGSSALRRLDPLPEPSGAHAAGSLLAPMPGTVVSVSVRVGDEVPAGRVLLALEAMKMEHAVTAPADGVVVEVRVASGDQVDAGAVLVVLGDAHG